MPVAEPVAEPRQISTVRAFIDVRRREAVDPAVRQGGVTETFTAAPRLAARPHVHRPTGHVTPSRVAGVPGCGSVGPDCAANRAVQAVGTEHQVTAQLTVRALHPPVRRHVGDRHPGPKTFRWKRSAQDVQQGRAVHHCDVTEPVADLRDIGAREPPTAIVANAGLTVEDGLLAPIAPTSSASSAFRAFGHSDSPAPTSSKAGACSSTSTSQPVLTQADRGCKAGDATADDDCPHAHRVPQSVRATL